MARWRVAAYGLPRPLLSGRWAAQVSTDPLGVRNGSEKLRFSIAVASAIIFAIIALSPHRVKACSCGGADPLDHLTDAHVVFLGRVVGRVDFPPRAEDQAVLQRATVFEVRAYWRGRHERYRVVESMPVGSGCGVSFEENASYVIVAKEGKSPSGERALHTGFCERNRLVRNEEDIRPFLEKLGGPSWGRTDIPR